MKILFCDSDFLSKSLIVSKFSSNGHEVTVVENGVEAMRKISESSYDLFIIGMIMPLCTGIELTDYIRNEMKQDSPIVMLTQMKTSATAELAFKTGVNCLFVKPLNPHELYMKAIDLRSVNARTA